MGVDQLDRRLENNPGFIRVDWALAVMALRLVVVNSSFFINKNLDYFIL